MQLDFESMTLREMQRESAKALSTMEATNNNIWQFNKAAHHDSQKWYRAVISWYVEIYGGLPSLVGPGKDVVLLLDV